jgi:hypothetical protein
VIVSGDYAYVAAGGLRVIDITSIGTPRVVAHLDTRGTTSEIALYGRFALLAAGCDGLQVIDVTKPSNPLPVGNLATADARGLAVTDAYVYLTDYYLIQDATSGLQVLPLPCDAEKVAPGEGGSGAPARMTSLRAWSVPAYGSTSLHLELLAAGLVRVMICDVTGRRVRTLEAGSLEAGPHDLPWDGRDDQGREVPAGTYLARMAAGDESPGAGSIVNGGLVVGSAAARIVLLR